MSTKQAGEGLMEVTIYGDTVRGTNWCIESFEQPSKHPFEILIEEGGKQYWYKLQFSTRYGLKVTPILIGKDGKRI